MSKSSNKPEADLKRIIASAKRLGIELDEAEALQWLSALQCSVIIWSTIATRQHVVLDRKHLEPAALQCR